MSCSTTGYRQVGYLLDGHTTDIYLRLHLAWKCFTLPSLIFSDIDKRRPPVTIELTRTFLAKNSQGTGAALKNSVVEAIEKMPVMRVWQIGFRGAIDSRRISRDLVELFFSWKAEIQLQIEKRRVESELHRVRNGVVTSIYLSIVTTGRLEPSELESDDIP